MCLRRSASQSRCGSRERVERKERVGSGGTGLWCVRALDVGAVGCGVCVRRCVQRRAEARCCEKKREGKKRVDAGAVCEAGGCVGVEGSCVMKNAFI